MVRQQRKRTNIRKREKKEGIVDMNCTCTICHRVVDCGQIICDICEMDSQDTKYDMEDQDNGSNQKGN
jgi:hypothetical protein